MREPLIAGFGFATIGERPDLADLDRALGRIEDAGASHAELALFAADLIAGGGSCRSRGAGWRRSVRRRRLRYTAHGTLSRQLHGRGQPRPAQGGLPGQPGAGGRGRRHGAGPSSGPHPGAAARTSWTGCTRVERGGLAGDGRSGRRARRADRGRDAVRRERPANTRPTRSGSPPSSGRWATRMSSARSTSATAT